MTTLPSDFHFSQASLQDYADCRRRFQLRYLENLAWPAVEAQPALENERRLQVGAAFHRLVQQHLIGLPEGRLSRMAAARQEDMPEISRWWESYLQHGSDLCEYAEIPGLHLYPEISLSAPIEGAYRWVAKYDLVAVAPDGRAVIFDWKTYRRRPERQWLHERLQTRLYPYLLVQAGSHLTQGETLSPTQVEMVFWYPEFPNQPERFAYSQAQFEEDQASLKDLVAEIERLDQDEFYKTQFQQRCRYCTYRSLCDRGVEPGELEEVTLDHEAITGLPPEFEIDFDQIAEIEF